MPVDLAEDSLELTIELLEAGRPTPTSHPFPSLARSGKQDQRTFRTVVLENAYLRATIIPELGGRILRLEDKRAKADAIPYDPTLTLADGGLRGVTSPSGIQVATGFEHRLNSMGLVPFTPDFTEGEDEPSALWWGEVCGDGLSLNVRYSMPADQACLEVEVRAFNRRLHPTPYNGGLAVSGNWIKTETGWLLGSGLFVESDSLGFGETNGLYRFNRTRFLSPRQLDAWKARIYPYAGVENLRAANSRIAVGWDRKLLTLSASEEAVNAKVVVLTDKGASLEVPVDLRPEHFAEIPLDSLSDEVVELVVLDSRKNELIRAAQLGKPYRELRGGQDSAPAELDRSNLEGAAFEVGHRHLAHLSIGYRHFGEKEYARAAQAFEQSLLFNAEDHLTWWMKGLAERLAGGDEDECPEILNAHFLAPLEPALRAESYLASPSQVKEKAAVLSPLEAHPEHFVEVACLLLEAGLLEETAKWIDEALRHMEMPMLRYLLAYAYLKGSRMDVQAAEQIQMAVSPEPQPPYPWREIEREALTFLAERFPADGSLARMLSTASPKVME